jgi:uncharacterized protein with HEPN domain
LRSSRIELRFREVPWQELSNARDGPIRDLFQHTLKVKFRFDAVELFCAY